VAEYCDDHKEHCSRMTRAEKDIQDLWKNLDGLRLMFIGTMGAVALQTIFFFADKVWK
jgi:hypothetical protein